MAHTIFPDEVGKLIMHANSQRFTANNENDEDERIEVSDTWMQLLHAHPFRSNKKGKFVHLLKKGSKPLKIVKARKKFEPMDMEKVIGENKRMRLEKLASERAMD